MFSFDAEFDTDDVDVFNNVRTGDSLVKRGDGDDAKFLGLVARLS